MARVVHVEHEHAPPVAPEDDAQDGLQARVRPKWVFPAAVAAGILIVLLIAVIALHSIGSNAATRQADARVAEMQREMARRRARPGTLAAAAQHIVDRPTGRRAQEALLGEDSDTPAGR